MRPARRRHRPRRQRGGTQHDGSRWPGRPSPRWARRRRRHLCGDQRGVPSRSRTPWPRPQRPRGHQPDRAGHPGRPHGRAQGAAGRGGQGREADPGRGRQDAGARQGRPVPLGPGAARRPHEFRGGAVREAAATALGLSEDALRDQLEAGKSLAEVADARNVEKSKVVAAIRDEILDNPPPGATAPTRAQATRWPSAIVNASPARAGATSAGRSRRTRPPPLSGRGRPGGRGPC